MRWMGARLLVSVALQKKIAQLKEYRATHKIEYYKPYPFQLAFHHAKKGEIYTSNHYELREGEPSEERALICGNQIGKCQSVSSSIETSKGRMKIRDVFGQRIKVPTYPDGELRNVVKWIRKPPEECFRITMSDGQWFESPRGHRVLTSQGYLSLDELFPYLPEHVLHGQGFLVGVRASVRRLMGTLRGYLYRYLVDPNLCGGQLLSGQDNVQVFSPLPDDALQHNARLSRSGGLASKGIYTLYSSLCRLSNLGDALLISGQYVFSSILGILTFSRLGSQNNQTLWQSMYSASLHPQGFSVFQDQSLSSSLQIPSVYGNKIVSVISVGVHTLYDMEVAGRHNYISGGMVHHNTTCAAMEVVYHATGEYPEWWKGVRFNNPITIGVGGKRNESVRDVCQNELCGDPFEESFFGTGAIPKDKMGKATRKAGVPNALSALMVKHRKGGYSKIRFMAFEQGPDAFMGIRFDYAWLDEEPPMEILSQIKRSMLSKKIKSIGSTFTPEEGITNVVDEYLNHMKAHQAVIRATWDDADHMTDEKREEHLSQFPKHEREMRMKGIPFMGSGLIFPVADDDIAIDPFLIPDHWPRICGIDFGYDHPFSAVWIAYDRDNETSYVYDCFRVSGKVPPIHASAIKGRGDWMPIAWPHDGFQHDKGSGIPLADQYRDEGLKLLKDKFSNPPAPGQKEGQGGNGVEVGLFAILTKMETGRFKVFSNLYEWFEEKNMYHRKEGKIDKVRDDIMSATRYAEQSLRFASTKPAVFTRRNNRKGYTNW